MRIDTTTYETVIGLEVHAQLLTKTKLFCGDTAAYGAAPNTQVSPVTLAHPGTLPWLNQQAVRYAISMGLACQSQIERVNYFARKHYFYPDLPKGYQISQHTTPICRGGFVRIKTTGGQKQVRLNRIHLEEDAGKSIHDLEADRTSVDFNRAGVPLVEIVSEPDLRSGQEAYQYLTELRKILRFLAICDGNMEEGSIRCDANVSVRRLGDPALGTKVEVKNLNSIRNVKRAIDAEAARMMELLDKGEPVAAETRSFDAARGTTFALRTKEQANDYRYFPDPDLPPFLVTDALLEKISRSQPALPEALWHKYTSELQLSEYDAQVISDDKELADYFERLIEYTANYKAAANWLLGPVKSLVNEKQLAVASTLEPAVLAELIGLVDSGSINFSTASGRLFPELVTSPGTRPLETARRLNLLQHSDVVEVSGWVDQVLERMPDKVDQYRRGKKGLMGLFAGEVKKISRGRADMQLTNQLLLEKLNKK